MRAILVHALDETAAGFYEHFGFQPATADPLTLMVPLEAVRRTLRRMQGDTDSTTSADPDPADAG